MLNAILNTYILMMTCMKTNLITAFILSSLLLPGIAEAAIGTTKNGVTTFTKTPNPVGTITIMGIDGSTYDLENLHGAIADLSANKADVTQANSIAAIANTNQQAITQLQQSQANFVDKPTYNTDKTTQAAVDLQQGNDIAQAMQSAGNAQKTADNNTNALKNKVDTTAFSTDQQRQDGELQKEITDRTDADSQLRTAIGTKADAAQVATNKQAITDEVKTEATHYQTLTAGLSQKVAASSFAQRSASVDKYLADAAAERAATNATVAKHTDELANHEQRIETLEQNTNANFGQLKNEVDQNRKRASAGIAGVAAMANIPQVIESQRFNVGAGVGTTDGETALAVGFSARASEHVVVKASVSNDTQHNFVVGGGMSYGW